MTRVLVALAGAAVGAAAGPWLSLLADRLPEHQTLHKPWWPTPGMSRITVAAAALLAAIGGKTGADWSVFGFWVFGACLLVVTVTDLRHFIIPNRVIYPTLAASIVLLGGAALLSHDLHALKRAAIGGALAWFALLVMHLISPRGMAFGDVRLASVIGAYTGWLSYGHTLLALFLAFIAAAVIGGALILTRRRTAKEPVPFGPFLALGATAAVLFGTTIIHWYRGT
jgi:leader peptidase (prepilin peptidase) / N-methyltransferase